MALFAVRSYRTITDGLRPASTTTCHRMRQSPAVQEKGFPTRAGHGDPCPGAFLASTLTWWLYDQWLTWALLIGSAAFDGILYLLVKDVIVCYRCDAHYRGVTATAEHKPFELTIHERYRQEKIRREQLQRPQ